MNGELLSDSVDVLKRIKAELQGTVDDDVMTRLNGVIRDLEAAKKSGLASTIEALEILLLLGSLVEKIPEIAEALDYLVG